jgi:hypothetical protein
MICFAGACTPSDSAKIPSLGIYLIGKGVPMFGLYRCSQEHVSRHSCQEPCSSLFYPRAYCFLFGASQIYWHATIAKPSIWSNGFIGNKTITPDTWFCRAFLQHRSNITSNHPVVPICPLVFPSPLTDCFRGNGAWSGVFKDERSKGDE